MKFHAAIYDPAQVLVGSDYWTWRATRLPRRLLDAFYYDVAVKHRPDNPNQLPLDALQGGCAGLDDSWCCWYCFVNGGRDQRGRPGRFVLLAAFVDRNDLAQRDWSGILECPLFRHLATLAPTTCPLPQPPELEVAWEAPFISCDPVMLARALGGARIEFKGAHAIQDAVAVCAHLPRDRRFDCHFTRRDSDAAASVVVGTKAMPAAPSVLPAARPTTTISQVSEPVPNDVGSVRPPWQPQPGQRLPQASSHRARSVFLWGMALGCLAGICLGTGGAAIVYCLMLRGGGRPWTAKPSEPDIPAPTIRPVTEAASTARGVQSASPGMNSPVKQNSTTPGARHH